ncbi:MULTISPECIES: hypothetical protein [Thermomonospora]|uniref:Uncharacterized protein n=1 Tax=Thermomonospora cellulosilytica TaxID=1411118 RepID=A0A7W3MUV9_9ACTN|nr:MULTISPECIES: hypothetical protein [Thermomonospora]MBA9002348.1 hypothetical protein [Thermomonospora cellulosilytica]
MSAQSQPSRPDRPERGASEEAAGAPLTETERETSRRPAGQTPEQPKQTQDSGMTGGTAHRPEEFNPDDFE